MWTFFTELLKFFNNLFINPRKQVAKIIRIYDSMNKIIELKDVERILIFKVHNGGGIIKPTGELYSSVLYEDYTSPFTSVKEEYQKLPLDKETLKMLMEVMQSSKITYTTSKMSKSMVKDLYMKDNVRIGNMYFLAQDRKSAYFVSIASSRADNWMSNPSDSGQLDVQINKIRNNIK